MLYSVFRLRSNVLESKRVKVQVAGALNRLGRVVLTEEHLLSFSGVHLSRSLVHYSL